jgi:cyclophilin family peptidyl-prolyl cis-trans isomerase
MNRAIIIATAAILSAGAVFAAAPAAQSKLFVSPIYTIDKIYHSMEGPSSVERIYLGDPTGPAELVWVTGIRTEMVDADGKTPQLPELMCHVNVDLDPAKHQALFGFKRATASRLMTLSQGMLAAKLPAGFGFPLASNEPLLLFTQVLNLNIQKPENLKVRHRVTIDYVRDRDLTTPIKPLFNVGASGMVQLDDNPIALAHSMASMPSTASVTTEAGHDGMTMNPTMSCLAGARAPQATSGSSDYVDPQGRKMTGHWIVPPGKQVNHSDITWFMNLQFDTRLHYAAAHLHPFARSLEIRDMTTGQTVFLAKAQNPPNAVGLLHVDELASADGVPLIHTHKYSLISTYDNPTNANADSMASVFLGLDDSELVVPTSDDLARTSAELFDNNTLVMHTNIGTITASLNRERAPETVIQVARFVHSRALDSTRLIGQKNTAVSVALPMNRTASLLQPTRLESGVERSMGTVSYCRPGGMRAEATIMIDMQPPKEADNTCVGFGRIVKGIDLLAAIAPGTSASVVNAETLSNASAAARIVAAK